MNALLPTPEPVGIVTGGPVERVVARSWTGMPLTLGLDDPFRLLGGEAIAPARMPLELALDWAPGLQAAAIEACMRQSVAGRPWFTMPPTALIGRPGIGRTLMTRRLARCAGVPFVEMDVAGPAGALRLQRPVIPPDASSVSDVVYAMASSRCANPVVLITGIERADEPTIGILQQMTDPASASRWTERSVGAVVDLGEVSWLVQSPTPLGLPKPLSHLRRVEVKVGSPQAVRLRATTILSELLADFGAPSDIRERAAGLLDQIAGARCGTAAEGLAAGKRGLSIIAGRDR